MTIEGMHICSNARLVFWWEYALCLMMAKDAGERDSRG